MALPRSSTKSPSLTVPLVMFAHSCLAFLLGLFIYISTLTTGSPALPDWATSEDAMFLWLGMAFSFVVVAYFTLEPFHTIPWLPRYPPLFHADRGRIRLGYSILFATAANALYWLATQRGAGQKAGLCGVISLSLIFPVYFALH